MKRNGLCKFSLACAIISGVLGGIASLPFILTIIEFALIVFIFVYFFVELYLSAILFSASGGRIDLFFSGTKLLGTLTESFIAVATPVIRFSVYYISPYAGIVAIIFGIMGMVASSVTISKECDKQKKDALSSAETPAEIPETATAEQPAEVTEATVAAAETPAKDSGKKRAKKKRSDKRVGIASLVVCSVFTLFSLISAGGSIYLIFRTIIQLFIIS